MDLNGYILQVLKYFVIFENSFRLKLNDKDFVEINRDSITINNRGIEDKILCSNKQIFDIIGLEKISNFFSNIGKDITRINHLGISYSCESFGDEISYYKKLISGTSLKLFEEKSDSKYDRWFFIGNPKNNNPLFEIVLTESSTPIINDWVPHFQIDFNTSLDYEAIVESTESLLATDFIKWKLDIPNYGTVLTMGILGNINGTKVALGIGTDRRGKQKLKEV